MKYILITAACAECRSYPDPLMEIEGPFDTVEEAKNAAWSNIHNPDWREHPQGGWFNADGQGDDWVLPVPDNYEVKKVASND